MSAVESWFTSAAVAEPLPRARPQRRTAAAAKPKPRAQQRQRKGFRVRGSLVFMVTLALLLVGVVAVNVAVLRAHVSVNDLDNQIQHLQQTNRHLAMKYSRLTAPPRLQADAQAHHLILAQGPDTTLIDVGRGK